MFANVIIMIDFKEDFIILELWIYILKYYIFLLIILLVYKGLTKIAFS